MVKKKKIKHSSEELMWREATKLEEEMELEVDMEKTCFAAIAVVQVVLLVSIVLGNIEKSG